ncbi:hypothetical protein QBC42DRAFT_296872 [Cladorrhinum samala]|uniref:Uncharacterized protein n=1 Tax=Cladorrhinum samala TaxID=585594 RepID=A0AAV9HRV2_9PEZI|nr:hypothetical protein QBC42DRAFT_296872 [Cladorrhinum samala]
MATFSSIEYFGISSTRDAPTTSMPTARRRHGGSICSTTSSISLQSGPIPHNTLLSSPPAAPCQTWSPSRSPTSLADLEPEDMTWNLETYTMTRSVGPQPPDGPIPMDRFASTIERHEQLALALQRGARKEPTYVPHPPHQYTQPTLISNNVSIHRYLTDSDQTHEYLAYMLEQNALAQKQQQQQQQQQQQEEQQQQGNNNKTVTNSHDSSISLDGDVLSAAASDGDDEDQHINQGIMAETRLKTLVAEMKEQHKRVGRSRVYKSLKVRSSKPRK